MTEDMLIEEIKKIKSAKSEWKKFGIMIGIILTGIGFYLIWKRNNYFEYVFPLAAVFFVLGWVIPSALKHLYRAWMALAVIMGFIMTKVIMMVIFFLIITPIGFAASLTGKKFLDMKIDKDARSYWIAKKITQREKSDYEKQF